MPARANSHTASRHIARQVALHNQAPTHGPHPPRSHITPSVTTGFGVLIVGRGRQDRMGRRLRQGRRSSAPGTPTDSTTPPQRPGLTASMCFGVGQPPAASAHSAMAGRPRACRPRAGYRSRDVPPCRGVTRRGRAAASPAGILNPCHRVGAALRVRTTVRPSQRTSRTAWRNAKSGYAGRFIPCAGDRNMRNVPLSRRSGLKPPVTAMMWAVRRVKSGKPGSRNQL